jgi:glucokinase
MYPLANFSAEDTPIVIGIDLGGTNVRAAALDPAGNILASFQMLTRAHRGPTEGLARITDLIQRTLAACSQTQTLGIGIGSTSPIDRSRGTINNPYTLPTWSNVPIVAPLAETFACPVVLENDADMAALGEYWRGAGQGVANLYAVTVGTGVGTAAILDGQILRGRDGSHPEGGHQVIDPSGPPCYCGSYGCWEQLIAGPNLAIYAQQRLAEFPDSELWKQCGYDPAKLDARMIFAAARHSDPLAEAVVKRTANYLALGIVNIAHFFCPEVILFTGGVMTDHDLLLPQVAATLAERSLLVPADQIRLLPAALGGEAPLIGAAYAILQELNLVESLPR